jgi:hypothetical protein
MPQHRIVASLGALDDLEIENLRASIDASRRRRRVVVAPTKPTRAAAKPQANLHYLDIAVAMDLWREWGLGDALRELMPQGESEVSAADIVEVLATQRLVAPASKLAATRWFPRTALPELLGIKPSQCNNTRIHRVLDDLEAATPALMAKLPRMYRERDGAFVSLFMDVTDAWFVGHGPELAMNGKTKEGLIARKIGIVLLCNERGYPLRWEVIEGNRNDSVAMTEMTQAISGLNWVGDAPVVLDRAMGQTAHVQALAATKLRFLTALTRTEFSTYAADLPWAPMQDLPVTGEDEARLAAAAARQAEAAGMAEVDDTLFVRDFGVVQPVGADADELPDVQDQLADHNAVAMRLCRQLQQSLADGRHSSYAAAATALGVNKDLAYKYRALLGLATDIQQSILDGAARRCTLESLIEVARLDDPEAQRAAFDGLLRSEVVPRTRSVTSGPVPAAGAACESGPDPLRVRVVGYFNPGRFVRERNAAIERLQAITKFAANLNKKLASGRDRSKSDKIVAEVDRRLRRDDLVEAFKVTVTRCDMDGRSRYQVAVDLDEAEWRRRRRYDGFSVLVGHADLPHTAAQLCLLYRAKDMVEKDFGVIKSVLKLRPIRHRTDLKVRAHVTICMLALLLERTLREKLGATRSPESALEVLDRCQLNRYRSEEGAEEGAGVYTITELDKEQRSILRKLRLLHLADDDHLAARITPR